MAEVTSPKEIKRTLASGMMRQVLDEAKVPMRLHLRVIKLFHDKMQEMKKDREQHKLMMETHVKQIADHEVHNRAHSVQIEDYKQGLDAITSRDWTGPQGPQGKQGELGPIGPPGKDADHEAIVQTIVPRIVIPDPIPGKDGKDAIFDMELVINELVKVIKQRRLITAGDVNGLQGWVKDGVKYRFEELMHGAGKSTAAALTILTIAGTVDDSNMAFTYTTKPTLLNINGAFYSPTGGAITWTATGGNITLSQPVGLGGQIFGI